MAVRPDGPFAAGQLPENGRQKNSILPVYETVEEFRKRASGTPEAYYIAYPNVDNGKQISYLASRFSYSNNIIVKSKGYSLEAVRFYND